MSRSNLSIALPDIQTMQNVLERKPRLQIGVFGGRSYFLRTGEQGQSMISVKLKELVRHLYILSQKETQAAGSSEEKESTQTKIQLVANTLGKMDLAADARLAKATRWQKFLTMIRRFFGNLGRTTHIAEIYKIYKKTVNLRPISVEAEQIYADCRRLVKIKKKDCSELLRKGQTAIVQIKNQGEDKINVLFSPKEELLFAKILTLSNRLQKLSFAEEIQLLEKLQNSALKRLLVIIAFWKEKDIKRMMRYTIYLNEPLIRKLILESMSL